MTANVCAWGMLGLREGWTQFFHLGNGICGTRTAGGDDCSRVECAVKCVVCMTQQYTIGKMSEREPENNQREQQERKGERKGEKRK